MFSFFLDNVDAIPVLTDARSINDIMEFTKLRKLPGLMIAFDFEKAFDSLSWNFLLRTLKAFNFGESFITWISVLYTNILSCVTNNGF